jgi:hypothetical protein
MNCFQNHLEISTSSIFSSSLGNFSCIENAFVVHDLKEKITELSLMALYHCCTVQEIFD